MKLRRIKSVLASFGICLFIHQSGGAQKYPSQEQHDWVGSHFFDVFEELFPVEERLGFSLGYRSYRDLYAEELESSFVINRTIQEKYLTAVVRVPDSVSLYDQIMALHRKNPSASIEMIKSQLKIKEWRLSEERCPALRRQYDEFYSLSLAMLSSKDKAEQAKGEFTITLHPRVHVFKADISGGNMDLVLTESDHSYVRWAEKTHRALEECAVKPAEVK